MCVHYICKYSTILWWQHRTHLKLTHTSTSIWNISYFRPWSWRNCTCVDNKFPDLFTDICIKTIKFLMSIHYLGFRILGFYHRVQWRGAKTAGKKCWGSCHWMMPSLLDFAQNCSLQIEWWNQKLESVKHVSLHFMDVSCTVLVSLHVNNAWTPGAPLWVEKFADWVVNVRA